MSNKAVYIGAGLDFKYIKYMPDEITNFYFIDSRPFSKFGILQSRHNYVIRNKEPIVFWCCLFPYLIPCIMPRTNSISKMNGYSCPYFLDELKKYAENNNLELLSEEDNKLIFIYNKKKTITYFINTSDPEHLNLIRKDIKNFGHLMIMGYLPNREILRYTDYKPIIWGNFTTFYGKDRYYDKFAKENKEDNKITYLLNYNKDFREEFSGFNLIKENGSIFYFSDWDKFVLFANH